MQYLISGYKRDQREINMTKDTLPNRNNENKMPSLNFIESIIEGDIQNSVNGSGIKTRFPPEPNGYLHIGHAKSICLNFGLASKYQGQCNLRFDDTNPVTEETEYVDSIKEDIKWLGFEWDSEHYTSDYFGQLYEWAMELIIKGVAYVDDQTAEEISATRGTPTRPGVESPYRNRPIEENLTLFERMKKGEFPDGSRVLRAKIDMASPNMHMRDPAMYRIKNVKHHRTGDEWCIYPMYDFAHGQSDYIEGVTHSVCTLEFEVHRPLYDWFLDHIAEGDYRPHQYEFARLNLSYTVMSKRKLLELVEKKIVSGWDDPRMPTVSGLRRRGYTPASIRNFSDRIGVARRENLIDVSMLEHSVREDLNKVALRRMAVLDPVKLTILNYPENDEIVHAVNNPENPESGKREVMFGKELYIERNDFMEDPPRKFFRLGPGRKVRLKYGYIIECTDFKKDPDTGQVTEIYCNYFPESKSGQDTSGIKAKGVLHWVNARYADKAEVRLYDRLFLVEDPLGQKDSDFKEFINPDSLEVLKDCYVEPALKEGRPLDHFQFERLGYFCVDRDSSSDKPVFNRTVALRDNWAKIAEKK